MAYFDVLNFLEHAAKSLVKGHEFGFRFCHSCREFLCHNSCHHISFGGTFIDEFFLFSYPSASIVVHFY